MAVKARDQVTIAIGVDVASVETYYKLQSSTATPPTKPTVNDPLDWSASEPTYDGASTNTLYTCQKTTLTDGTFYWSAVSKSTSYEAAKSAWNLANSASEATENLSQFVGSINQPYQEVEWVESDGREFIQIEWRPGPNWGFDIDFINYNAHVMSPNPAFNGTAAANRSAYGWIFGQRNANNTADPDIGLGMYSSIPTGVLCMGKSRVAAKMKTDHTRQQCSLRNGTYNAPDGNVYNYSSSYGTKTTTWGMTIFACGVSANLSSWMYSGATRLYSLKFYDGDTLAVDLVPTVRNSDNMPGLYDRIGDRFYACSGLLYGDKIADFGETIPLSKQALANNPTLADTKTGASRLWTADAPMLDKLEDGQQITYQLKWNTASSSEPVELANLSDSGNSSNVYLSLKLSDGTNTDWIPCYHGISGAIVNSSTQEPSTIGGPLRLTNHFVVGSSIQFTYRENVVAGTVLIPRGWFAEAGYNTFSNTNARYVLWYNTIVAKAAIRAHSFIVGDSTGYTEIADGVTFDLSYPILWTTAAIAVNKTNYSTLFTTTYDRSLTNCYPEATFPTAVGTKNQILYLVGKYVNGVFTIKSPVLTFTEPSTEDGFIYIPVGKLGNNTTTGQNYFIVSTQPNPNMFMYLDGSFKQVSSSTTVATQKLYYRTASLTPPTAPVTWVATNDISVYNSWNRAVPPLAASTAANATKYPYLYSVEQHKRVDGTIISSDISNDSNTTIIDGGSIITNSITANQIKAGSITATEIDASDLHVLAANIDGTITANQINATGLTIGYSQVTNTPTIPSKVSDLTNDSQFQTASQVDSTITSKGYATTTQAQGYADAKDSAIAAAAKRTYVSIAVTAIDYAAGTATLQATLFVDGIETTSGVTYIWLKDGTAISGQTARSLSVTAAMGLEHVYSCIVTYS